MFDPKVSPPSTPKSEASCRCHDAPTRPRRCPGARPLRERDGQRTGSATHTKGRKRPCLVMSSMANKGHIGNGTQSRRRGVEHPHRPAGSIEQLELAQHMKPTKRIARSQPHGLVHVRRQTKPGCFMRVTVTPGVTRASLNFFTLTFKSNGSRCVVITYHSFTGSSVVLPQRPRSGAMDFPPSFLS